MNALAVEPSSGNLLEADAKISHSYAFDDLTDKENPDFRVSTLRVVANVKKSGANYKDSMLSSFVI